MVISVSKYVQATVDVDFTAEEIAESIELSDLYEVAAIKSKNLNFGLGFGDGGDAQIGPVDQ
uniref:hypothetical protein n=1 Tax=Xanthomonas albilineans TaxID=29447 RepID=UPI0027DC8082|nr:hypothetical protein [Xanthomonas albilineans]